MGKSDRRALESHLKILMPHLLKWDHQPSHRGGQLAPLHRQCAR